MITGQVVLVTGASGFIGANLTKKLVSLGNEVHVLTKKTSDPWRLKNLNNQVTSHHLSLTEKTKLKRLIIDLKPQYIFHLAARGAYQTQNNLNQLIETNILGLVNLLNALEKINYQSLVNTGTSSEYGFKNKPMKETDLLEPISYYAATKAGGTLLAQVFARNAHHNIITLRPFSVYGPWEEPGRFIPTIILRALQGKPLQITGGKVRHDFVYIDDMVEAYLKAAVKKNLSGKIFNIGSGWQYTNFEVAQKVVTLTKNKVEIIMGAYMERKWDTNYWVADNSCAQESLGWQPKTSLEAGLKKTIAWLKTNQSYYEK